MQMQRERIRVKDEEGGGHDHLQDPTATCILIIGETGENKQIQQ